MNKSAGESNVSDYPMWIHVRRGLWVSAEQDGGIPDFVIVREPVRGVLRHPHLKEARHGRARGAPAVDEILLHAADFRDVEVRGDEVAVGQHQVKGRVRVVGEDRAKLADVHPLASAVRWVRSDYRR